jgi:hypothetical protein
MFDVGPNAPVMSADKYYNNYGSLFHAAVIDGPMEGQVIATNSYFFNVANFLDLKVSAYAPAGGNFVPPQRSEDVRYHVHKLYQRGAYNVFDPVLRREVGIGIEWRTHIASMEVHADRIPNKIPRNAVIVRLGWVPNILTNLHGWLAVSHFRHGIKLDAPLELHQINVWIDENA